MTKIPHDGHFFMPAFMASGVFCFIVAVFFMLSAMTGNDVTQPFSLVTSLICR